MKDESKAGILLLVWMAIFNVGMLSQTVIGYLIAGFATVLAIIIVWYDERNERTKKRLQRYTNHANKEIRRECDGSRENIRE